MVSLRLLERCLPVLADHHERRQEDGFQRDDKGERGPRALLEDQHPDREERHMDVDEVHRPGEGRYRIRHPQLHALCALPLGSKERRMPNRRQSGCRLDVHVSPIYEAGGFNWPDVASYTLRSPSGAARWTSTLPGTFEHGPLPGTAVVTTTM